MKNKLTYAVLALLALSVTFTGCEEDEDPQPQNPTTAELIFHLHTLVGNNSVAYGTTYQTASGRSFNISDFQYYLSNIVLIKSDGSELPLTGKVILARPTQTAYSLGEVPAGNYLGFKFIMGLDSATNHMDPTTYPAGNPLAIQTPSVHWAWSSGYIFMKVEGMVDTTLAANGPLDLEYFYHIGMDTFKRNIDFSTDAFTVTGGVKHEIGIEFDLLDVLANVDMRTENETHTMNNMPLAMKIANNWPSSFTLE
ncbi:MAG TPA: hypothetical protein PKM97_13085 [Bacteroidia bacterium]|nr:hypothetical protein [Bacteroidia bacterium]